jgi:hypothetical protein
MLLGATSLSNTVNVLSGSVVVAGTASIGRLNAVGGIVTLSSSSNITTMAVSGGTVKVDAAVSSQSVRLLNGVIAGTSTLSAVELSLSSQGFDLNAAVSVSGSFVASGLVALGAGGGITLQSSATFSTLASFTFVGLPGCSVVNNGVFNVATPVVFTTVGLLGTGTVVANSTLSVQAASLQQSSVSLSGAGVLKGANTWIKGVGKVLAVGSGSVSVVLGPVSFQCDTECDTISTPGPSPLSFAFSV